MSLATFTGTTIFLNIGTAIFIIWYMKRTFEDFKKTRKRGSRRKQKEQKRFDFSDLASLIIRARFDRRMHYSVAFRCRLCIAFVDVQAAAFVGKPVRFVWKSGVSLLMPQNRSLWQSYRIWDSRCNSSAITWPFHSESL